MSDYTYLATDALTGAIVGELPLTGVSYATAVNGFGQMTAKIPLSGVAIDKRRECVNGSIPGRTLLDIYRDGQHVWGGFLWGRKYAVGGGFDLDGAEVLSYLDHVFVTEALTYTDEDLFTIVRGVVDYALGKAGAWSDLTDPNPSALAGVTRTLGPYTGTEGKSAWAVLGDLLGTGGVEVRTDGVDSGGLVRRLLLGAPTLGRTYAQSGLVAQVGVNAGALTDVTEDGHARVNAAYAIGADGSGNTGTAVDAAFITNGWPLLEGATTHSETSDLPTLNAYAAHALTAGLRPPVKASLVGIALDGGELTAALPGDELRVIVPEGDARWPDGLDTVGRIEAVGTAVATEGHDRLTFTLLLPNLDSVA